MKWLSNFEIHKILKKHTKNFKRTKVFFPEPIDFEKKDKYKNCKFDGICNESFKNLKKYNKIAFVFNTDVSSNKGIHWVALFIKLDTNQIIFYDSNNNLPDKRITNLIKRMQNEAKKENVSLKFARVNRRHQMVDGTCGLFVIHFIMEMIKGISLKQFRSDKIDDKLMYSLKKEFEIK